MALTRRLLTATVCISLFAALAASAPQDATKHALAENLSLDQLDEQLQVHFYAPFYTQSVES